MSDPSPLVRRPPPPLRRVAVDEVERVSSRLVRVTFAGPDLEGFPVPEPAASVRLLVPSPDGPLEIPEWSGNVFLYADGARADMRTLTPLRVDPDAGRLDVEIVDHGDGPLVRWARRATPGDELALSGPGRGWPAGDAGARVVLAGDESALPAIGQILEHLPRTAEVDVHVEVAAPDGARELPAHPRATVQWYEQAEGRAPGERLVDAVTALDLSQPATVWVAGEAAAVQRIRRHLFVDLGLPRAGATVRGYWKHGRAGDTD